MLLKIWLQIEKKRNKKQFISEAYSTEMYSTQKIISSTLNSIDSCTKIKQIQFMFCIYSVVNWKWIPIQIIILSYNHRERER